MSASNTTTATEQPRVLDKVWGADRFSEFMTELDRLQGSVRDFKVDSTDEKGIDVEANAPYNVRLVIPEKNLRFTVNPFTHGQLASKFGIDKRYYDKCLAEQPELLADNIRAWMRYDRKRLLIRTLDDNARAVLSDRYRILDHQKLLSQAVIPAIKDVAHDFGSPLTVQEAALTERKLYMRVTTDRVQGEVRQGEFVQAGFIISNSEVGAGSWKVEQFLWKLDCLNGMISGLTMRKFHMGRGSEGEEGTKEIYSDRTNRLIDKTIVAKTRDVVRACLDRKHLEEELDKMRVGAGLKIHTDPAKLIEVTGTSLNASGFRESEKESIMTSLMDKGDMTLWGLSNAVTDAAKTSGSYDRKVEMERMGGMLIGKDEADWVALEKQATKLG